MTAYYNEFDAFAAQWLRNLISAGHIAPGDVDERSIVDVQPDDLRGYAQCHFFAGIGGWSYALRLAGWDDARPVWTGSCPCQPFSAAGKQQGAKDERHLWPDFFRLIRECRPERVFGEQVAGAVGFGWLDGISADLEAENYAVGAVVLGAHSVGAPHIRQRLWWVADANGERRTGIDSLLRPETTRRGQGEVFEIAGSRDVGGGLGNANQPGSQGRRERSDERADQRTAWSSGVFVPCADGKARRVEPGIQPLAHGVSNRVGILRGAGNAIVPQVAAEFIGAFMECAP